MNPFLVVDQLKKEVYITWAPADKVKNDTKVSQIIAFKLPHWYREHVVTAWLTKNDYLLDTITDEQRLTIELEISDLFIH